VPPFTASEVRLQRFGDVTTGPDHPPDQIAGTADRARTKPFGTTIAARRPHPIQHADQHEEEAPAHAVRERSRRGAICRSFGRERRRVAAGNRRRSLHGDALLPVLDQADLSIGGDQGRLGVPQPPVNRRRLPAQGLERGYRLPARLLRIARGRELEDALLKRAHRSHGVVEGDPIGLHRRDELGLVRGQPAHRVSPRVLMQQPVHRAVRGRDLLLVREPRRDLSRRLAGAAPTHDIERERRRNVRAVPVAPPRRRRGGRGAAVHAPSFDARMSTSKPLSSTALTCVDDAGNKDVSPGATPRSSTQSSKGSQGEFALRHCASRLWNKVQLSGGRMMSMPRVRPALSSAAAPRSARNAARSIARMW
jgi:hypothetical protein